MTPEPEPQYDMTKFKPVLGWTYTTPTRTARTSVHFFLGNKHFTLSLCKKRSYLGQPLGVYERAPGCPQCIQAGKDLGVFD